MYVLNRFKKALSIVTDYSTQRESKESFANLRKILGAILALFFNHTTSFGLLKTCAVSGVNEESPPEPAPPEVPPRGPSLHSATLRRRAEYSLPVGEQNNPESQFLSQGGKYSTCIYHAYRFNISLKMSKNPTTSSVKTLIKIYIPRLCTNKIFTITIFVPFDLAKFRKI